jgi:DNA (cytosine-5)-methyltransferase 1
MLTCGSLFTGIGGFDLGFEKAGIKILWQVEINEYYRRVLARHFPGVQRFSDIHDCGAANLAQVDIICGGDPCQENSNARRAGSIRAPSLGGEFLRVVAELRPRIVVRENPAAVRADAPWPWWRFRCQLESLGYAVLPFRLRACCIGADIRRDRLFLLAELQKPECQGLERHEREELARASEGRYDSDAAGSDRWSAPPRICGATDRVAHRVERLRSLGNAVVPRVAQWIGAQIVAGTSV